jgi:hypothetical protein
MVFLILTLSSYKIQKMVNQYCYFVVGPAASSTHISPSGDFGSTGYSFQRNNVTPTFAFPSAVEIIPFPSRPPLLRYE